MPDREPETQDTGSDPRETRLQADPMLRAGRVPWGWPVAIAAAVIAIAAVLFAASYDQTEVAEDPASEAPVTRSRPPPVRGVTNTPAERKPADRGTTGSGR